MLKSLKAIWNYYIMWFFLTPFLFIVNLFYKEPRYEPDGYD